MIREEYFKKLETKLLKYWNLSEDFTSGVVELAREIAKYTDDEKKVARIVNGLRRANVNVYCIEDLMAADINELAKVRNIGHDALNILRQIKGLPTTTYADEHPFSKKKNKDEIVEQLEKLGYLYSTKFWDDGTVCTHRFIRPDCMRDGCYWEVAIEDHTDDDGEDWLIFVSYHDPDQKDWEGRQIDICGAVEYKVMKLIVEFVDILESESNGRH